MHGPIQEAIEKKLMELTPLHLEVVNESHGHSVPRNSETHFKVIVVSSLFSGMNRVNRHRKVYEVLATEMAGGVHALALHTFSPEEWEKSQKAIQSPPCLGGQGK